MNSLDSIWVTFKLEMGTGVPIPPGPGHGPKSFSRQDRDQKTTGPAHVRKEKNIGHPDMMREEIHDRLISDIYSLRKKRDDKRRIPLNI